MLSDLLTQRQWKSQCDTGSPLKLMRQNTKSFFNWKWKKPETIPERFPFQACTYSVFSLSFYSGLIIKRPCCCSLNAQMGAMWFDTEQAKLFCPNFTISLQARSQPTLNILFSTRFPKLKPNLPPNPQSSLDPIYIYSVLFMLS